MRSKSELVEEDNVEIPWDFLKLHLFVVLTLDVMFMNGIPFLITHSRQINLITIEFTITGTAKLLAWRLLCVFCLYFFARFVVMTVMMDMEFNKVKDEIPQTI